MSSLPEALLARLTTPDRAAAIYGDITELATTRGRLWFWATYIRALISLGWRTPLALAVGFVGLILFRLAMIYPKLLLFSLWIYRPVFFGSNATPHVYIYLSSHPYIQQAIYYSALQLCFLAPLSAVLYGLKDRYVRLGFAALLLAITVMLSVPYLSPFLATVGLTSFAILLALPGWRRPAIALVGTIAIGGFTLLNLGFLAHMLCWIEEHKPLNASSHYRFFETGYAFSHTLFWIVTWTIGLLNMLALAIACSRLHKRPSQQPVVIA